MTTSQDYYEILGIPHDADQKQVKDAFRALALRYHPDRNKDPEAENRFKEIAEAYAVLYDPQKRADYDTGGRLGRVGFSPEDLFKGVDFEDILGGLGFDLGGLGGGGLFNRFFHPRRSRRDAAQGANLEISLQIPLSRVYTGGEETVHVSQPQICTTCNGSGAEPGTMPKTCDACKGTGQHVTSRTQDGIQLQQITTCSNCQGRGNIIATPCRLCNGRGEVQKEETLTVNIPVGIEEGMVLRIPEHGLPPHQSGGKPGDLYVVVRSLPDPRFERQGADLWCRETINVEDAILGSTLQIPTLDAPVTFSISPGTQPDAILKVAGMGLPEFGSNGRGDLYLRIQVKIPDHLCPEERKLYEQLRTLHSQGQAS